MGATTHASTVAPTDPVRRYPGNTVRFVVGLSVAMQVARHASSQGEPFWQTVALGVLSVVAICSGIELGCWQWGRSHGGRENDLAPEPSDWTHIPCRECGQQLALRSEDVAHADGIMECTCGNVFTEEDDLAIANVTCPNCERELRLLERDLSRSEGLIHCSCRHSFWDKGHEAAASTAERGDQPRYRVRSTSLARWALAAAYAPFIVAASLPLMWSCFAGEHVLVRAATLVALAVGSWASTVASWKAHDAVVRWQHRRWRGKGSDG